MARINHVKKARQRFHTRPVLDENGEQKTVAVLRRDGSPKLAKGGRAIVRRLTEPDPDRPKPNYVCESCGGEIEVGQPYKWVEPKTSAYGGRKRTRCAKCPTWRPWDLSNALWARVAQIQADHAFTGGETVSEYEEAASSAAEAIRELAEEKEEAAGNIRDGFGHDTEQSEELDQIAQDLNQWADDMENINYPDEVPEDELETEEGHDAFEEWQAAADEEYDGVLGNAPC